VETLIAGLAVGSRLLGELDICGSSGVCLHAWPVETLEKALFCFVDTIVTDQQISMGIRASFRNE